MLIRSWNLFHGRSVPPTRRLYLEEALQVVTADRPSVVLLQEVPAFALDRLGAWSGMTALGDVARRARVGPLPIPAELGRLLTAIHPGVLRSAFSGQANAILLAPGLRPVEHEVLVLNAPEARRQGARQLGLDARRRRRWARERRICSAVRLDCRLVVANLHASNAADERVPAFELSRAAAFVDELAHAGDVAVLGGDFNVSDGAAALAGWSPPGPGIDHVLVRGAPSTTLRVWPEAWRRLGGILLSDHAPVELEVEL